MPSVKDFIDAVCAVTSDRTTVDIARWVMMDLPGRRRAKEFLQHYLNGSGADKIIDMQEFLRDCPVVRQRVSDAIFKQIEIEPAKIKGSVPLPQGVFGNSPSEQDWRYATGSLNMNWQIEMLSQRLAHYTPRLELPGIREECLCVLLSFTNIYRWHPEAARISQCVHKAANNLKVTGAKEFNMKSGPTAIEIWRLR